MAPAADISVSANANLVEERQASHNLKIYKIQLRYIHPSPPSCPPTKYQMYLVRLALRLLRLAGEAFFCFEINRFLGQTILGPIRQRLRRLPKFEARLLNTVRAPLKTLSILLPNGLRLHTLIVGHAAKATSPTHHGGKPLVLLHGHSMAAAFFFRNLDDFLDLGYTTIYVPDLPGWGRSSRPVFKGSDADAAVDFFLTPLRLWLSTLNLPPFALCGHSLGAYVAHEYATRHRANVTRLILAAPAAITRHTSLPLAAWFALTPQSFLTHGGLIAHLIFSIRYPQHAPYNTIGLREFTLYTNSIADRSGDAAAAKMLRFLRIGLTKWRAECVRPLLERVSRLQCPIDIVAGDRDELVHVEAVRALHRAHVAVGNDVRLNVIPGADHSPHISAPSRFAKAVMRGMGSGSGSSGGLMGVPVPGSLLLT